MTRNEVTEKGQCRKAKSIIDTDILPYIEIMVCVEQKPMNPYLAGEGYTSKHPTI